MQLQGLTDKQAEAVLSIVEICGIDFDQARKLLEKVDYNIELATQSHFNFPGQQHVPYIPQPQHQVIPQQFGNEEMYYDDEFDENQDPAYTKFRNFKFSGATFQSNYPLPNSGINGVFSWFSNKFKGEVSHGEQFLRKLEELYPGQNKVKFLKGNFLQAMYLVKKQKFPLIVFLNDFNPSFRNLTKTLISNPNITQFFNQSFRIIGFNTTTYKLDGILLNKIDPKNIPCLAVFKVDDCQQIAIMDIIQLNPQTDIKELKKRLNTSKNRYIKDEIKQDQFKKRFNNQINGIYDNNPMTFERKLELAEQRKIKAIQQKQLKESNRQLQIKKIQQEQAREKEKQKQNDRIKILQQRKIDYQNLKIYDKGIRIRLRFPNSQQIQLVVPLESKIEYLFDYVNATQDIGLQQDVYRKFDIIRPYDKLTLSLVKDKTLLEVFGETDSESLVVNEL